MVSIKHSEVKYYLFYCADTWQRVSCYNVKHISCMSHCRNERCGLERMPHLCWHPIALGFERASRVSTHANVIFCLPIHFYSVDFLISATGLEPPSVDVFIDSRGAGPQGIGRSISHVAGRTQVFVQDFWVSFHSWTRSIFSKLLPHKGPGGKQVNL